MANKCQESSNISSGDLAGAIGELLVHFKGIYPQDPMEDNLNNKAHSIQFTQDQRNLFEHYSNE